MTRNFVIRTFVRAWDESSQISSWSRMKYVLISRGCLGVSKLDEGENGVQVCKLKYRKTSWEGRHMVQASELEIVALFSRLITTHYFSSICPKSWILAVHFQVSFKGLNYTQLRKGKRFLRYDEKSPFCYAASSSKTASRYSWTYQKQHDSPNSNVPPSSALAFD